MSRILRAGLLALSFVSLAVFANAPSSEVQIQGPRSKNEIRKGIATQNDGLKRCWGALRPKPKSMVIVDADFSVEASGSVREAQTAARNPAHTTLADCVRGVLSQTQFKKRASNEDATQVHFPFVFAPK